MIKPAAAQQARKCLTFQLGQLTMTCGIAAMIENWPGGNRTEAMQFVGLCIGRHAAGDWGVVPGEDAALNDEGVRKGYRIISAYELPGKAWAHIGEQLIWIITEADRSATTVLLPSEY